MRTVARRTADGVTGTALTAGWGVAEALWLPVMPDVAVAVLTLWAPRRWRRLAVAAIAGSMAGGAVAHRLGAAGRRPPLLLVTPRMVDAVDGWFDDEGARGVLRQPLSGVPFKVFASRAAGAGVPVTGLVGWAAVGRGARLLAVARAFAGISAVVHRRGGPALVDGAAVVTVVGFAAGLRAVVRRWS